mgnify:CR=1 FL=1
MPQCTAPVNGHRSASARANCPACGGYSSRSYNSYPSYSSYSSYGSSSNSSRSHTSGSSRQSSGRVKARWSPSSSTIFYTPEEIRTLSPVRDNVEKRIEIPDLRDVFLCHAWDDRKEAAKELHDMLEENGVSVWFSEKDVLLGSSLLREIDKGLAKSKVGIVLVTPNFLTRIKGEGIADKELSALLAGNQLVPIVHNTTYEALRNVSPLLASRSGLDTGEDTLAVVATKIAELITV